MVSNITPALDPELDRRSDQGPSFRYAIYSQQRSGSAWLCALLSNLGEFGIPVEYLNGRFTPEISRRLLGSTTGFDLSTYLDAVESVRTSPSGRFGIKIQPNQLSAIMKNDLAAMARFFHRYDAIILLTRQDKLAQAVSGGIAQLTANWRSDGKEPDLSSFTTDQLIREMSGKLARYLVEDSQMISVAEASGRPLLHVTYERLKGDPEGTLEQVVRFLGLEEGFAGLPVTKIVNVPGPRPGTVAAEVRQLLLDFIEGRVSI